MVHAPSRSHAVTELLLAYSPTDEREQTFRQQMLKLAQSEGDPFERSHFVPGHFTASAFILSPDREAVLLIHHTKLARWLQPGGHVATEDADVLATARREVMEEVALAEVTLAHPGIFDIDVHDIPMWKNEPAHCHFDVRFLFLAPALEVEAGSDVNAVRWVKLSELGDVASDESVCRALRKLG